MSDTEINVPTPPVLKREKTLKVDKVKRERKTKSQPVNNTVKLEESLKARKNNNWVNHVKQTAESKGLSYKEAMKEAKLTYKKE